MGTRRSFQGRTVLISGAAGGLGRALAVRFGRAGANLALVDLRAGPVAELARELEAEGFPTLDLGLDITDFQACQEAVAETLARFGSLEGLINNAGISHRSLFAGTDISVLRKVIEVNLLGSVNLTKAALPALIRTRGLIMAVSTVAGFAPLVGRSAYAASKHALHGFFDTLRAELKGTGVEVGIVCPGFIATPLEQTALGGDGRPVRQEKRTVGRVDPPEKAAEAVFRAAARSRRLAVLSGVGRLSYWVSRLAPGVYERLMIKRIGPEFGL